MNIEINGTTYELRLGFRFSKALDKVYKMEQDVGGGQKVEIGMGVTLLYSYLSMGNFEAVVNFYTAGLLHHKKRPTEDEIIEAVENIAAEKGITEVAEECIEGLRESGFYRQLLTQIEEAEGTKAKKN
ncbi:tail chaperone protein [Bacillus phage Mgbh1]|uniref:Tail assembly-like protein n=1 Tax=Bacillus phage Mgbh1 TaxID=1796993 RepID=A0A142F1M8_9CAUD|nr:tail chaperone protein [Bacillus phage Mgbh1]AMQ66685.1 tail assembly-like protein [Bacillus phage Mgbh1]